MKNPKTIINKLKRMAKNLKANDIVEYFPTIVDDLNYLADFRVLEMHNLTREQQIENIYEIEYHKIDYLATLIKKYMELEFHKELSYKIEDGYLFNATGGYNQKEDKVVLSILELIDNSLNLADDIRAIAHEFRHQLQYRFLHEKDIQGILDYPSYFIKIARSIIPKEVYVVKDKEGSVIKKPYYNANYKRLYSEVDAQYYAVELNEVLLSDLYNRYPNKDSELAAKIRTLQIKLSIGATIVRDKLEEEHRIDRELKREIYKKTPITSKVLLDGEEQDSLLCVDKCIKNNPVIRDKYEVFGILMNDYTFKDCYEITLDKYSAIDRYGQGQKLESIYSNIINGDPMCIITNYLIRKDIKGIKKFIQEHPTFTTEYEEEINELLNKTVLDIETINLLSKPESVIIKNKKGN